MSGETIKHPEYLDKSFFQKIIEVHSGRKASVKEFTIRSGSKPSENLASDVYRVGIDYECDSATHSVSVIVKTMMSSGYDDDIDGKRLFDTEIKMYGEVLVDINRLVFGAYKIKLFPR